MIFLKRIYAAILLCVLMLVQAAGCKPKDDEPLSITPVPPVVTTPTTSTPTTVLTESTEPSVIPVPSGTNFLTGLPVDESFDGKRPVAIMYNNLKPALPMSGISEADIIFEALAEGGITRMVGVFVDPFGLTGIGSVRSTRSYYLDLALSLDAILVHAGGSPQAYNEIPARGVTNIDFTRGWNSYQWRDKARMNRGVSSEHCLFTSGKGIQEIIAKAPLRYELKDGYTIPFEFTGDVLSSGTAAQKITLKYSDYKTGVFEYDADKKAYLVSQYGKPFVDGNGDVRVSVTNVLVLSAEVAMIKGDSAGRITTKLTGTGIGWYSSGGKAVKITWSRKDGSSPFVFKLEDGSALKLTRGKTYINIFPSGNTPSFE